MALNSKYVGFERIIENVYRDYDLAYDNYYDMIEWIAAAIHKIGVGDAFTERVTDGEDAAKITVSSWRGTLPTDLIDIVTVRDYDTKISLRESTNKFHKASKDVTSGSNYNGTSATENTITEESQVYTTDTGLAYVAGQVAKISYDDDNYMYGTVTGYDSATGTLSVDIVLAYGSGTYSRWNISLRQESNQWLEQYTYQIKDGYIYTSAKDMTLEMVYKAFPVDTNGYPAIPDNEDYIDAVCAFVAWKIAFKMRIKNQMPRDIYDMISQAKAYRIRKVQNTARIPRLDKMQSILNQWVKLIPDINSHTAGFVSRGNQEQFR